LQTTERRDADADPDEFSIDFTRLQDSALDGLKKRVTEILERNGASYENAPDYSDDDNGEHEVHPAE
jgi:hypothetical protein